VTLGLSYWFELLFHEELHQKLDRELTFLWKKLKRNEFGALTEIFLAYQAMSLHLITRLDTEGKLRRGTIPARCMAWWNAHRRCLLKLAAIVILCAVLFLSAFCLHYYQMLMQLRNPHFHAIGTVELDLKRADRRCFEVSDNRHANQNDEGK
jgi:hypothetical protein